LKPFTSSLLAFQQNWLTDTVIQAAIRAQGVCANLLIVFFTKSDGNLGIFMSLKRIVD
jgi:hypothetical protein